MKQAKKLKQIEELAEDFKLHDEPERQAQFLCDKLNERNYRMILKLIRGRTKEEVKEIYVMTFKIQKEGGMENPQI